MHGDDVGGPLGHPVWPVWFAVVPYDSICIVFITGRSTVKPDMLADCLLMSAIRHVHFNRPISAVVVVIT